MAARSRKRECTRIPISSSNSCPWSLIPGSRHKCGHHQCDIGKEPDHRDRDLPLVEGICAESQDPGRQAEPEILREAHGAASDVCARTPRPSSGRRSLPVRAVSPRTPGVPPPEARSPDPPGHATTRHLAARVARRLRRTRDARRRFASPQQVRHGLVRMLADWLVDNDRIRR